MAPSRAFQKLSVPSKSPLQHGLRLPSNHPAVFKALSKLSRPALIELAIEWCLRSNRSTCGPFINYEHLPDDPQVQFTAANSIDELVQLYQHESSSRRGSKREILDRMLEGDWRHGISMLQMAMAETQCLLEHGSSHRWTAFQLTRQTDDSRSGNSMDIKKPSHLPRIQPSTFLLSLHEQISPLTKAHYYFIRPKSLPITLFRVCLYDTPYSNAASGVMTDGASQGKSLYLAFPDGTPFVYISLAASAARDISSESRSLQALVINAIPTALSRAHERYALKSTSLTARSLTALLAMRGAGRENAVGGGWSIFADEEFNSSSLDFGGPNPTSSTLDVDKENETPDEKAAPKPSNKRAYDHSDPTGTLTESKRQRLKSIAAGRFGVSGQQDDGKGIPRFDVRIQDSFSTNPGTPDLADGAEERWKPNVKLSFQGSHVFAGLRKLVEIGVIDGEKMPAWLTGEANVSLGVVADGRMEGWTVAE